MAFIGLIASCGIGAFFIKRHYDEEDRKRKLYLAEQDAYYRKAEAERVNARRARERMEEQERARASTAISSINFAPAYAAPLAASAGLSGAVIRKTHETPRPTPPKPVAKPAAKPTPTRRVDSYEAPSYPSYSSSSSSRSSRSSSDDSSSSSSSWSSSSSSDFGGGGSSSDW